MDTAPSSDAAVAFALDRFRKPPERLNCAQAVFAAFGDHGEGARERYAGLGGGRAEGGVCGALYAAKSLVREPAAQTRVERAFVAAAGSPSCRDIRALKQLSCHNCVATACRLVSDELTSRDAAG
jgi:hypothetical protein